MTRKRPFLLLEVLIAVILIGAFSFVSLHGFYRTFYGQRNILSALEYARQVDLERMDLIAANYLNLKTLAESPVIIETPSKTRFTISCKSYPGSKYHLLTINQQSSNKLYPKKSSYHYFIAS